jgi:hypothetical protein
MLAGAFDWGWSVRRTGELSGQLRRDVGGEPDGVRWSIPTETGPVGRQDCCL